MSLISFETFQKTRLFPCLDGIRAVAVMWVVFYHCPKLDIPVLKELQLMGDLGVDLFFVLSGFLITTLILREKPAPLFERLKGFYWRRALRIFPVYYLGIIIYWLAVSSSSSPKLALYNEHVPALLLYLIDFKLAFNPTPFPPLGHAWSLAIEEKYYLLWPFVAMALPRKRGLFVAISLIFFAIIWRLYISFSYAGDLTGRLYYAFDTRFDAILWGVVLAYFLKDKDTWDFIGGIFSKAKFFYFMTFAFFLLGHLSYFDNGLLSRYILVSLFSFSLIAGLLQRPNMPGTSILDTSAFKYVGKVSYAIYIFHPIAISVAIKITNSANIESWLVIFMLSSFLSILIAGLKFRVS